MSKITTSFIKIFSYLISLSLPFIPFFIWSDWLRALIGSAVGLIVSISIIKSIEGVEVDEEKEKRISEEFWQAQENGGIDEEKMTEEKIEESWKNYLRDHA